MRYLSICLLLCSTFVSAQSVIPSSWMTIIRPTLASKVELSVVSPTIKHPYSFVKSGPKICEVFMVHNQGKDTTWPMVKTSEQDIPVFNALIAMHEIGHCAMGHNASLLKKKDLWLDQKAILHKKTFFTQKEVDLNVWYDEHFADMYGLLWLSHVVDERDFGIITDYLIALRENNAQDLEHNTLAMVKEARQNYWVWRQTSVNDFVLTAAIESLSAIDKVVNKEGWSFNGNT